MPTVSKRAHRSLMAAVFVTCATSAQAQTGPAAKESRIESLLASVDEAWLGASSNASLLMQMRPWLMDDANEGQRNRVLNDMEVATIAFSAGHLRQAEILLSDAQQQIETIYADNPAAQAARSNFVPEASKDFKGDPYERAMVGYYLGLTDLAKGDYDNARAGFRFASLQDTMSASEVYQDDMALMHYLIGWTHWCEGNRQSAKEEFSRAGAIRPQLVPPAAGDNLLMIGELGNAPQKVAAGQYNELLGYRPGPSTAVQQVAFAIGNRQVAGRVAEDLYFQASTRGGAAVDSIRAGKANFRQGAEKIADVASGVTGVAAGAAYLSALNGNSKDTKGLLAVSVVAGLTSLVSTSVAKNTETAADARAWSSLPGAVHIATGALTKPTVSVEAGFFSADGRPLQSQVMIQHTPPKGTCTLAYAKAKGPQGKWASADASKWNLLPALAAAKPATENTYAEPATPDISDEGSALLDMVRMMRENPNAAEAHGLARK